MTTIPIPTRRRATSAPSYTPRKPSCWTDLSLSNTNTIEPNETSNKLVHPLAAPITQHNNTNDLITITPSTCPTEDPITSPIQTEPTPDPTTEPTVSPPLKKPPPSEALQLHMTAIIQEELRTPPATIPRGRCCVCFSPDEDLVFVCQNELTPATASSPATTCEGALCLDCTKDYIHNIICDSKYSIPAVRCPGRCFCSIPSASWRGAIHFGDDIGEKKPDEQQQEESVQKSTPTLTCRSWKDVLLGVKEDEEAKKEESRRKAEAEAKKKKVVEMVKKRKENIEFESRMVSRFESNSSTVLSIRCGACDNTCDMSEVDLAADDIARREVLVARILSMGGAEGGHELQELMFSQWVGFMQHRVSAVELVATMSEYIDKHDSNESDSHKSDEGDVLTDDRGRFFYNLAAPLMRDVERRSRFLLTVYKKFPKFFVQCCPYAEHCFACKVDNWHTGFTCEEQQLAELDIEAQFCPECGVPTIRTDGCSDMLCACGCVWEWEGDDDDDDY